MRAHGGLLALAAGILLCPTLVAQDSTSKLGASLPGDAVAPWSTTEQVNTYVVDLAPLLTSWRTTFGIAPLVKASKASSTFANNSISAQGVSQVLQRNAPFPSTTYSVWNAPGTGINNNATIHNAPQTINTTGLGPTLQFGAGFAEFGTTDGGVTNENVITSIVNFLPNEPSRLYVARVNAAVNGLNSTESRASIGMGSVDDTGAVHFRADSFQLPGPNALQGNNYFRVEPLFRTPNMLNLLDNSGLSDTGEWLLVNNGTTHNTPSMMPTSLLNGPGRPLLIGSNFNDEVLNEPSTGNLIATQDHLTGLNTSHRGSVHVSKVPCLGGEAIAGMLGQDVNGDTRGMLLWGLDTSGDVTTNILAVAPASITDPEDGHLTVIGPSQHYRSQTAFRGGNGQVAMSQDAAGDLLAATTFEIPGSFSGPTNRDNVIAVARLDCVTGAVKGWSIAAYVDGTAGKQILNAGGSSIGQLTALANVTNPVTGPFGPSLSAPGMDSAGNVWFVGAVELFDRFDSDGDGTLDASDFDTALIRAVYNANSFTYRLEKVVELGQVFEGENSKTEYSIAFMPIADSNSVSSGTFFSGNMIEDGFNGRSQKFRPRDPRSLGGLVFHCAITYDTDGDGSFSTAGGVDENYDVLMFLGQWPEKFKPATRDLRPRQL